MISKETASNIYHCHREIEAGESLLLDIQKVEDENRHDPMEPLLSDVFGKKQRLQLGIPSGKSSHRLFGVSWLMAEPIIKAHIAHKRAELAELSQVAIVEAQQE